MAASPVRPFVEFIKIRNYKSIGRCEVRLNRLTVLVGPNGSGKSNFLDALRFVADALRTTLEHAIRDRGGINEVRRRSYGHPHNLGITLGINVPDGSRAIYEFQVGSSQDSGYQVVRESCKLAPASSPSSWIHSYVVERGRLREASFIGKGPDQIAIDRLYLTVVSALPEFRALYDGLSNMGFYNLNPDVIRDIQDPDPGELLDRDGRNMASVIRRLRETNPAVLERIIEYLQAVVPGVRSVDALHLQRKETLEFRQEVRGAKHPWKFSATNMSDGTLRALGVLVAAFQTQALRKFQVPLVGIEEPEIAIHPGAAVKLMDALLEAKRYTQILITTHSPELLDHPQLTDDMILAVEAEHGETYIAPVDQQIRQVIRNNLYTVGHLLRLGQLQPDRVGFEPLPRQLEFAFQQ
ncbi:SMC domain protein [Thermaerobacter marianensis DSM 12885]|uniref:SMC domain protein n=1 Tax=Thermaerobacter marianensis (strain ATCC 700841 / DSM 12885 / JCM 10246 / 7p75a) TaxID=644966 RepID=E6SGZ0_THEM7|nr:AAA family ATPase [Thermaerobacter marianensis]ADU50621.1 SMC domain protein [Thermaerobacter marianensis DSM 12885]